MKALIIYDSLYGSTEKIARAMGEALGGDAKAVKVTEVKPQDIAASNMLIIGSPTQGGRTTAAMKTFLDGLTSESLAGKRVAAFDTRMKSFFVKMFGWAANRIEASFKEINANATAQPQGFFVKGAKGPLVEGELERAAAWARSIVAGVPTSQMPGEYQQKHKE
jgi:flavodoxin I